MSDPDKDFLAEVAGLPANDPGSADAALGRDVRRLMRQAQDEEAAELARQSTQALTPEEEASIQRTLARLRAQGHIDPPAAVAAQPTKTARVQPQRGNWLQALRDALLGTGWQGGLAFAMVALLTVAVLLPRPDQPVEEDVRGQAEPGGEQLVVSANPDIRQAELKRRLTAAGAQVVATQLSDQAWTLVVSVTTPDALQQVNAALLAEKLKPLDADQRTVTLTVRR